MGKLPTFYKLGIHSGKGGVGKTFVSVNIAYSLASLGHRVGLLDADIDCPNVPKFLSIQSIVQRKGNVIYPVKYNGISIISTALFNPPGNENPIIIRGPIKHNMLMEFLNSVQWGELDYLVLDLPPGTADAPLSAMQLSALDGLILVTSPSKEALLDTARAANMARKLNVKILGLVENMSGEIFGSHGEEMARRIDVPFLGSIPLSKEIAMMNENSEIAFLADRSLHAVRDSILLRIR